MQSYTKTSVATCHALLLSRVTVVLKHAVLADLKRQRVSFTYCPKGMYAKILLN